MSVAISEVLPATTTSTIDLTDRRVETTPHVFVGIKFIGAGGAIVTPSAGTFSITIKTIGMEVFESITGGDAINATVALAALSFATNADSLKYTPVGITGANEVQITVTGNLS